MQSSVFRAPSPPFDPNTVRTLIGPSPSTQVFIRRVSTSLYFLYQQAGSGRYWVTGMWRPSLASMGGTGAGEPVTSVELRIGGNEMQLPLLTSDQTSSDFVYTGTWLADAALSGTYGGTWRPTTSVGAYFTYTSPVAVSLLQARVVKVPTGGLAKVSIDGNSSLASGLPSAQDLVNSGAFPNSILIANGGTLAPTDRCCDQYSATTAGPRIILAEGLTEVVHTVKWEMTPYFNNAASGVKRVGVTGIDYSSSAITPLTAFTATVNNKALTSNVVTLTTAAAHGFGQGQTVVVSIGDAVFDGTYSITAVPSATTFRYAKTNANVASAAASGSAKVEVEMLIQARLSYMDYGSGAGHSWEDSYAVITTGGSYTVSWMGCSHGWVNQTAFQITIDGTPTVMTDGQMLQATTILIDKTCDLYNPIIGSGLTRCGIQSTRYTFSQQGLRVTKGGSGLANGGPTWKTPLKIVSSYPSMMTTHGENGDPLMDNYANSGTTGDQVLTDFDGSYKGQAIAEIAWVWDKGADGHCAASLDYGSLANLATATNNHIKAAPTPVVNGPNYEFCEDRAGTGSTKKFYTTRNSLSINNTAQLETVADGDKWESDCLYRARWLANTAGLSRA